ncbi:dihydropteroate synthase [Roseomonas sp. BN140053]|uniref:dihydropteroate synthase n=1 Tax=Roseomonas sp. BN140053 TaxID=3391898 RepID=UPI0039ECDE9F
MQGWIEPLGLLHGETARAAVSAGQALWLRGGPLAFTLVRVGGQGREARIVPASLIPADETPMLQALTQPLPPFAGLAAGAPGRPLVMGILNVTPDSFSDGGRYGTEAAAVAAGEAMLAAGADMLDLGAESTRPGAEPVDPETECARLLPVLRHLAPAACVSVDTRNARTMRAALDAGATVVNDISALRHDPAALGTVAASGCSAVLMHMPGTDPRTMQALAQYGDVVPEVAAFLHARILACEAAGIPRHRIAVDPGLGFGKTLAHNLELLDRLPLLHGLGCAVLLGASRKGFIGRASGEPVAARRLGGSLAAALAGAARGAAILRVHDVAETVQALALARAVAEGAPPP